MEECIRDTISYIPRITESFELYFIFKTKDSSGELMGGGLIAYKADFQPTLVSSPTQYINSLRSILDNKYGEYLLKFPLTGKGGLFVVSK